MIRIYGEDYVRRAAGEYGFACERVRPEVEAWVRQRYPELNAAEIRYSMQGRVLYSVTGSGASWLLPLEATPFNEPRNMPLRDPQIDCVMWA